ncbi:MAG: hypothetical protein JWQ09_2987 [Segetibacter sp.]|nr:hypothetical protein [Segetibacter sp.]
MQATRLIDSAKICTIAAYMSCMFDNDFKSLILEGDPTEDEIQEAWENINLEYLELSSGGNTAEVTAIKEVEEIKIKLETFEIYLLLQHRSMSLLGYPFFRGIKVLGDRVDFPLKWNGEREDFIKQLKKVEVRSKSLKLKLQIAESRLEAIRQVSKDKEKNKSSDSRKSKLREGFITILVTLPTSGYVIDRNKTTMEDLAVMIKQFTKNGEKAISEKQKKRNLSFNH